MSVYSFETEDLLAELEDDIYGARPVALLAHRLDMPKRKVTKLIQKARNEIRPDGLLIVDNGRGAFYLKGVKRDEPTEDSKPLLSMFG